MNQVARSLASTTAAAAAPPGSSLAGNPAPILVTSVEAARGLDFGAACDCVLILGRVKTPDDYQHVAGRTGRRRTIAFGTGRQHGVAAATSKGKDRGEDGGGVVVSIISRDDERKLGGYESMLGIRFERERGLDLDFI
jgi:superfamily II DNA/RNA helicase